MASYGGVTVRCNCAEGFCQVVKAVGARRYAAHLHSTLKGLVEDE